MAHSRSQFDRHVLLVSFVRRSAAGWCGCLPSGLTGAAVLTLGIWRVVAQAEGQIPLALAGVFLAAVIASTLVKISVLTLRAALLRVLPDGPDRKPIANPAPGVASHVS